MFLLDCAAKIRSFPGSFWHHVTERRVHHDRHTEQRLFEKVQGNVRRKGTVKKMCI